MSLAMDLALHPPVQVARIAAASMESMAAAAAAVVAAAVAVAVATMLAANTMVRMMQLHLRGAQMLPRQTPKRMRMVQRCMMKNGGI